MYVPYYCNFKNFMLSYIYVLEDDYEIVLGFKAFLLCIIMFCPIIFVLIVIDGNIFL